MQTVNYEKWDVHHHVIPEFYLKEMKKLGITKVDGFQFPKWSLEKTQSMMRRYNITKSFLSFSTPGVYFKDEDYSNKLARRCNEYLAELKSKYPSQFGGYASIQLPNVEGALAELQYSLDVLKLDGVFLLSNVGGNYLGKPEYRPIFEELNRRKAIVFIHVRTPEENNNSKLLNPFYWWFIDTTRTLIDMIRSGYHRDFPDIKYIPAHGAGVLPPLYSKLIESMKAQNPNIEAEFQEFSKQLYLDTAKSANEYALPGLLNFTGSERAIFGSDYIWGKTSNIDHWTKNINLLQLNSKQIQKIYKDNAQNLFEGKTKEPGVKFSYPEPELNNSKSDIRYHYHCLPKDLVVQIEKMDLPVTVNQDEIWDESKALKWLQLNKAKKMIVSFDIPGLWVLKDNDKKTILRKYNESVVKIVKNKEALSAFGAIDTEIVDHAIEEIDYCLNHLKLDGLCLYTNIANTPVDSTLDFKIIDKLSKVKVPIMIHPKYHKGIPIVNRGYLDATYFIAKIFYSNEIAKLQNKKLILTHTGGVLKLLAENIGLLYYMQHDKWHMAKLTYDYIVKKKLKGQEIIESLIIED